MKCSRVALSLLLAALMGISIALGTVNGQRGVAADLGCEQPASSDSTDQATRQEDTNDQLTTDQEEPWADQCCKWEADCQEDWEEQHRKYNDCGMEFGNEDYLYEYNDDGWLQCEYGAKYADRFVEEETGAAEQVELETDAEFAVEQTQPETEAVEEDYLRQYGYGDWQEHEYGDEYADCQAEEETDAAEQAEPEAEAVEEDYSYEYGYDNWQEDEYGDEFADCQVDEETDATEQVESEADAEIAVDQAEPETEAVEEDYSYEDDGWQEDEYGDEYADQAEEDCSYNYEEDYFREDHYQGDSYVDSEADTSEEAAPESDMDAADKTAETDAYVDAAEEETETEVDEMDEGYSQEYADAYVDPKTETYVDAAEEETETEVDEMDEGYSQKYADAYVDPETDAYVDDAEEETNADADSAEEQGVTDDEDSFSPESEEGMTNSEADRVVPENEDAPPIDPEYKEWEEWFDEEAEPVMEVPGDPAVDAKGAVLDVVVAWAYRSADHWSIVLRGISERISAVDWEILVVGLRSARLPRVPDAWPDRG